MSLFFSFNEAESTLCNNNVPETRSDLERICKEYGVEMSGFVMKLLSKICHQTGRTDLANDCSVAALKCNPFLWQSFVDLCNRGDRPNVKDMFQIHSDELLHHFENNLQNVPIVTDRNNVTLEKNTSISVLPQFCVNTPKKVISTPPHQFNVNASEETPLIENQSVGTQYFDTETETPYRKQFKYLNSNLSPVTPSFGILPLNSPQTENLKQTMLFITPSPPPLQHNQQQAQLIDSDKNISNKKIRGNLNSLVNRKEISTTTPLQQTQQSKSAVLNQSSNIASPNRDRNQQQDQQNVRRSSRIFSNYSVKENNKLPKFGKFVQPRSPPRKTSKRVSKSSKSTLNELNEKNSILNEKEKIETITSAQVKQTDTGSVQAGLYNISTMKRQSADGLMILLQTLGQAYLHLQHYELDDALDVLETKVPIHHYNTSWVQSIKALIYHEKREYEPAVKIFGQIRKSDPYRLEYLEVYSTDLWHLQQEITLSQLAKELMHSYRFNATTWCVAGNCFSALKEHDSAIKYFNRAIQLDPEFPYSYTLLGHELVVTEELEKALGCYRKAILKDNRHYNAW
jgi:anaphase-promoting complex subunit 3